MIDVMSVLTELKEDIEALAGIGDVRIGEGDLTKLKNTPSVEISPRTVTHETESAGLNETIDTLVISVLFAARAKVQDPQTHITSVIAMVKLFIETIDSQSYISSFPGCEYIRPTSTEYRGFRDTNIYYYGGLVTLECGWGA